MPWGTKINRGLGEGALPYIVALVEGPSGKREVRALLDTGATHSHIRKSIADAIGMVPNGKRVSMSEVSTSGGVADLGRLDISLADLTSDPQELFTITTEMAITPNMAHDVILGMHTLQNFDLTFLRNGWVEISRP